MTSKNLCFKLMKEDIKRRVWTVALLFLALFFCLVIPTIYTGGTPKDGVDMANWLTDVAGDILELLGAQNPFTAVIMIVAALVCGVSGFSYLHTAKKVDFYHSIPVKREQLFLSSYLNGILMMAVVYLLNLLIAMIAATASGVGFGVTFGTAISAYFFHMAFYSLLYTTVVLAMMMTGNIVVALLGTGVFFWYVPAVVALVAAYINVWFKTWSYDSSTNAIQEYLMYHGSPFVSYIINIGEYGNRSVAGVVLTTLIVTAVLAAFSCLLYRLRPSEAAGHAMAFKKSMTPIKILVVIPVSLAFCLFFYALRSTFGWAVFGILCGALITHCLMEIIYHFDFRKLFAHKIHLVICIVVSLLILCGFKFDWFGYDSYLPKAGNVRSASIYMSSLDDWVTYGEVEQSRDGNGSYYYQWSYQGGFDYVKNHMALDDPADILYMAEQGIKSNEEAEKKDWNLGGYYHSYSTNYIVQYTLNSGRKVTRYYRVQQELVEDAVQRIYDNPAYKDGVYPILTQTPEETVRANFQQFGQVTGTPEGSDTNQILAAYQEELRNLTYETRTKETPIATIQFVTADMDTALNARIEDSNSNGYYYTRDIADRCYYPVYPSFEKTLKLIKDAGIEVKSGLTGDQISQAEIWDYDIETQWENEYGDDYAYAEDIGYEHDYSVAQEANYHYVIKDKGELDTLAPALVYDDYYSMNRRIDFEKADMEILLTLKDGTNISCYIDQRKIPDFMLKHREEAQKNQ